MYRPISAAARCSSAPSRCAVSRRKSPNPTARVNLLHQEIPVGETAHAPLRRRDGTRGGDAGQFQVIRLQCFESPAGGDPSPDSGFR
jgi:hypothetical protein